MSWEDAKEAMRNGEKVTHQYFSDNEWMKGTSNPFMYMFEDGVKIAEGEFFRWRKTGFTDGWEIFKQD